MAKSIDLATEVIGTTLKGRVSATRTAAVIVKAGGKEVLKGAGGATVRGMANACGKQVGRTVLKGGGRLAGRVAPVLSVVEFGFDQAEAMSARNRGDISQAEYEVRTAGNVGSAAGGLGGSLGGAALGTAIFPGIGTVVGAFLGSWLGSSAGRGAGESLWE